MKSIFLIILISTTLTNTIFAQDCGQSFYAMKEKTKITMANYDGKGKLTGTSETTVKAVQSAANGFVATMEVNAKNEKGKAVMEARNFDVSCENGTIKLDIGSMYLNDMAAQMKGMDVKLSGVGLDIPATLSEGQILSDGDSEIKMGSNGMTFMTMKFSIKNRKVEKKEKITVGAGTYEAYKITYDMDMKVMFKRSIKAVQWLVPSIGMIKSETYNAKGELEGTTEMTKFEQ